MTSSGCSDDCGPGGASAFGLVASDATTQLIFGNLRSSANNDCPDSSAPAGVVSLTITGSQKDGTGLVTLCAPRPDLMASGDVSLVGATGALPGLRIVDLSGDLAGCTYVIETLRPPLGTAHMTGVCDNGTNKAGYALVIDGNMSMTKTCDTSTNTVALGFSGNASVTVQ